MYEIGVCIAVTAVSIDVFSAAVTFGVVFKFTNRIAITTMIITSTPTATMLSPSSSNTFISHSPFVFIFCFFYSVINQIVLVESI